MASRRRTITWLVTVVVHPPSPAAGISAEPWRRASVDALPDEAVAAVHVRRDGTRALHLPHHDADGRVDRLHLRSALARLGQMRWEDPADAGQARRHVLAHHEALGDRPGAGASRGRRERPLT
jgi:hypothetical protein